MSMTMLVWDAERLIGELVHDSTYNLFSFQYDAAWIQGNGYQLSPHLPVVHDPNVGREVHSGIVRNFFQNLLPEGSALDDAATTYHVSKSNLLGILNALGREATGAFVFTAVSRDNSLERFKEERPPRLLSFEELSERIRSRPGIPFTVWDGRLRLSIAGYQDKLAAMYINQAFYLPETYHQASTHILKPEPVNPHLKGMTTNELMCMKLAKAIKLPVANVQLIHVPEPVLVIERFDRKYRQEGSTVQRIQCIDGCQALGLSVDFKYEQPYGDGEDVRGVRSGASLRSFFTLLDDTNLVKSMGASKIQFLHWVIFQVLIGNTDAHAKNLMFYSGSRHLSLAPTYDLVSGLAFVDAGVLDHLAMAVGDNFNPRTVKAYDWALFSHECKMPARLVAKTLKTVATDCQKRLQTIANEVKKQGGDDAMVDKVSAIVLAQCQTALSCADEIPKINADYF